MLQPLLADPDPSIRVAAAEAIYSLGSAAGKQTLLDMLAQFGGPDGVPAVDAQHAAVVLNQYRETIPADLLIALQTRIGPPGVANVMAMQDNPRYAPFVLELTREHPGAGAMLYVGVLGSEACRDAAQKLSDSAQNETDKVAAAWALFRSGGDRSIFDLVVRTAAQTLDLPPAAPRSEAVRNAFDYVSITNDDAACDLLRRAALHPRTDISGKALASLFYVQRDYAFVDDYLRKFLADPNAFPNQDRDFVAEIAAARNSPELTAVARQSLPPDVFDYYFAQPRPPESWIWTHLSNIPLH